jgi:hypothetical protein
MEVHNVLDRRNGCWASWRVAPLDYAALNLDDVGRTVIYQDGHGRCEAGTLTSWHDGLVFASYSTGSTSAGAHPDRLSFGITILLI